MYYGDNMMILNGKADEIVVVSRVFLPHRCPVISFDRISPAGNVNLCTKIVIIPLEFRVETAES